MNRHVRRPWALALVALWMIGGWTLQGQERPEVTAAQVDEWMQELSNWGRWGADDQLGAVNLITPAKRRAALALATTGEVVSLSLPVRVGPPPDNPDSTAAFTSLRVVEIPSGFLMERQQVAFHGSTVSHLDALCHAHHNGQIYNGLALEDVFTEDGCSRMGISGLAGGIVTRGVLLDIPRLKGLDALETGTHVYPEDIEAWERRTGVTVSAGDAVFLRTGRWKNDNRSGYDITVAPLADAARRGPGRERRHPGRRSDPGHGAAVSQAGPRRAGCEYLRQHGSRGGGGDRGPTRSLGVPPGRGPDPEPWWHRLAVESARDLLITPRRSSQNSWPRRGRDDAMATATRQSVPSRSAGARIVARLAAAEWGTRGPRGAVAGGSRRSPV